MSIYCSAVAIVSCVCWATIFLGRVCEVLSVGLEADGDCVIDVVF